ncbi:phage tail protein [Aggregatibacter actinomycetemcomitans]|uniref:phage tail-collar fiber domain-containing protein n=1 Tax=Aggregatibacter actinomycetemcomitans TaxID=714 RepID=UPI00197CB28A|nr:phage tail protein [Aggregatibacter actinomycetemcomitans]MBN6064197.1 phage tail protein [Aggregatibacter actinomycetemcomitans]MBN6084040.1 phage tail protein [Aggregatibacter actinomycetemcomitans]
MAKYISILTDYGTQALAKALANNQPLRLMQFAVGDGNGQAVTPNANRTALVNEKHRANVSAVSLDQRNNKQIIVELTIPENVGGFFVREMGVFDEQNKLIAYANTPESYKPTLESGSGKIQVLRMVLMVSASNAVTLTVDNSVIFVTRGQLTPHTITANSANGFDQNGHSHAIDKASTTQAGIVQLTDDTGIDSDKLGLTARAGRKLAQLIATVQQALNNYIPLNKRSSAVNSTSNENVATSAAVKTAYDKGVEAKNAADNAQRTANDGVSKANAANNNANGRVSKAGDTLTGILRTVGIASKHFGFGSYADQYTSGAPFMVENTGSVPNDTYHPFIKGETRQKNNWGAVFSLGYTTKQGGGNGFGRGIINLIEDNGKNLNWAFEHDGAFVSAGDVRSSNGRSINSSVQNSEVVGEVAFFARTTPPSGWLKANGAAVSRTTYAALFAAIGTTFGAGDGRTTFNLPDLRGEFLRGLDDGRNVDGGRRLGSSQGDAIRNITGKFWSEFSSYKYIITTNADGVFNLTENDGRPDTFKGDVANYGVLNKKVEFNASRVVPTAHENRPRNIALLACIKY